MWISRGRLGITSIWRQIGNRPVRRSEEYGGACGSIRITGLARSEDSRLAVEAVTLGLVDEIGDSSEPVEQAELRVRVEVDEVIRGDG